jgi:hypothetical protein
MMDEIIKIKFKLARYSGQALKEDVLETMGVTPHIRKALEEDGFLEYEPRYTRYKIYRVMDSRDMIIAKETWKAGEETKKLTLAMLVVSILLAILAGIQICLQLQYSIWYAIMASIIFVIGIFSMSKII